MRPDLQKGALYFNICTGFPIIMATYINKQATAWHENLTVIKFYDLSKLLKEKSQWILRLSKQLSIIAS